MQAVRLPGPGAAVEFQEVAYPEPGPGEVVVRIAVCGVCGSDVHFLEGMPVPGGYPLTLGHEPAGVVESVGPDVVEWAPGDRVALHLGGGCGECGVCRSGHPMCCPNLVAVGLHVDGGFAEAVLAPTSCLLRVPDGVSLAAAAVATDCVATPYHALTCRAGLREGERVVVVGCGGLGSMTVKLAAELGAAEVIAVDRVPEALDRARAFGATQTVLADGDVPSAVRAILGDGADVSVECVGTAATLSAAILSLRPGGRAVALGVGLEPPRVDLPIALFSLWQLSLVGTFASHPEDLAAVLAMERDGRLGIEDVISHRVPLAGAADALDMLRTRRDDPVRIVVEANADLART